MFKKYYMVTFLTRKGASVNSCLTANLVKLRGDFGNEHVILSALQISKKQFKAMDKN